MNTRTMINQITVKKEISKQLPETGGTKMKRSFKLENLDCANCAAKMEDQINKLEGVSASVSFMTQRLNIEAEDMDKALDQAQECISKIEPDCVIKR